MFTVCTLRSCQFAAEYFFLYKSHIRRFYKLSWPLCFVLYMFIVVKTFYWYNFKDLYNSIPESKFAEMYTVCTLGSLHFAAEYAYIY